VVRRISLVFLSFLVLSCAVVQPPPGGPEDRQPPHVLSVIPAPDSAGVGRDTEISIAFSEKVDGDTFKERLRLYPPVGFEEIKVKGNMLQVRFAESLPETTLTLLLSGGYADLHGVQNKVSFIYHFATTAVIQSGTITGKVLFKNSIDPKGVVKLFTVIADSTLSYKTARESRITFAGDDGGFTFSALPTDSTRFILWAFSDENGDGLFAEQKEFHLLYPDTLQLTPSRHTATEIFINIIDPNEPGVVIGSIIDETGMGRVLTVRFEPLMPGETALIVRADSTGSFVAGKIPPGRYLIQAFVDIAPDSLCGTYAAPDDSTLMLTEPCITLPDTLVVEPGGERTLDPVTLRGESR
jgi:hypothetical protein